MGEWFGRTLARFAHESLQHSPALRQRVLLQVAAPLWREPCVDCAVKCIPLAHWQPFCSAAMRPGVDHAGRAAS
eukprot:1506006-Amphidinium_carterae.1